MSDPAVCSRLYPQPMVKPSPWGGHQGNGWGSGGMSWGRDHRRAGSMGVPGSVSHASPLKKPFSSNVIAPPKFPRPGGSVGPKSWIEENMFRTDGNSNTLLPLQVNFVLGCAAAVLSVLLSRLLLASGFGGDEWGWGGPDWKGIDGRWDAFCFNEVGSTSGRERK